MSSSPMPARLFIGVCETRAFLRGLSPLRSGETSSDPLRRAESGVSSVMRVVFASSSSSKFKVSVVIVVVSVFVFVSCSTSARFFQSTTLS